MSEIVELLADSEKIGLNALNEIGQTTIERCPLIILEYEEGLNVLSCLYTPSPDDLLGGFASSALSVLTDHFQWF